MNPTTPESEPTVVIRSAEDLLALIPCVFGFQPADSLVMVASVGHSGMHARVELPETAREREAVAAQLRDAVVANAVTHVAFVLYTDDPEAARVLLGELEVAFLLASVTVDVALRVADSRWFLMLPGDGVGEEPGVPFDTSDHPLVVRSVLAGQVTHASRDDLVASVAADPDRVAQTAALLEATPPALAPDPDQEATWVAQTVLRHVAARSQPVGAELARLLCALRHERSGEELICVLSRPVAREHAEFWAVLLPSLPAEHVAAAGGLLALAAWLAGDGALAWCAIDRVEEAPHSSSISDFVTVMLQRAVPPASWGTAA